MSSARGAEACRRAVEAATRARAPKWEEKNVHTIFMDSPRSVFLFGRETLVPTGYQKRIAIGMQSFDLGTIGTKNTSSSPNSMCHGHRVREWFKVHDATPVSKSFALRLRVDVPQEL